MWVEWVDMAVPNAAISLTLEAWTVSPHAAANNRLVATDTLVFYPFQSVVVALTGEQWSIGTDQITQTGTYVLAAQIRDAGYNVYFADEDEVASEFETVARGYGVAYDNVGNQIVGNGVRQVAIFGHSHGGGSTYDLASRLDQNRATLGTFTIPFTGYMDALGNQTNVFMDPELRRPPGTAFHTNVYQTTGVLHGDRVLAADDNFDVTGRPGMTHADLDDDPFVHEILRTRVFGKVEP
jgi:hypothetical protein